MEELICEVKKIIFRDAATGYTVLEAASAAGDLLRAAGKAPGTRDICAGTVIRLEGAFTEDPKYGREFAFSAWVTVGSSAPAEASGPFSDHSGNRDGARDTERRNCGDVLERLSASRFRSGFRLTEADREYVKNKGFAVIRSHAEEIVRKRLAPARPLNDGKQTPMKGAPKGHPVFIAQHATATGCRECLRKWHGVPRGREMTPEEQKAAVDLVMCWIEKQTG